jgi:hypothetical protein
MTTKTQTEKTRQLNDLFRGTFFPQFGQVALTQGVSTLDEKTKSDVITKVREYSVFDPEDDPYGEHDFGAFEVEDEKYFWKIDYYDRSMFNTDTPYGSEEPWDNKKTIRLLTIMRADEY